MTILIRCPLSELRGGEQWAEVAGGGDENGKAAGSRPAMAVKCASMVETGTYIWELKLEPPWNHVIFAECAMLAAPAYYFSPLRCCQAEVEV